MARVICLGVATLDEIFRISTMPEAPAKFTAEEFIVTGGGMAANAAVAVVRLGGQAAYWGRVGDDAVGDQVLKLLREEGVDLTHVRRLPGRRTKVSAIFIDARGERLVCAAPSQGYPNDTSWLPLDEVKSTDAVHADSRWLAGARALFDAAHHAGKPCVFDADGGDADAVLAIAQHATHPVFSEPMLKRLEMGDAEEAVRRAYGGENVIAGVTLGERGVVWFDGKAVRKLPGVKVKAVDTLAAGDTFHGALALALAEGQSVEQALQFANTTAAIKCTRFGGRVGIPKRAEVDAALAQPATLA